MCQNELEANGWTSMPANAGSIFSDKLFLNEPKPLSLNDIEFPFLEPAVAKTMEYARKTLHPETFNHSMRVYFYGMAISKEQFPEQFSKFNPVTWAFTCLLHDLGTAEENLTATRISFDIYGGIKATNVLMSYGATVDQAEAAAEAIIRHEDMGVDGTITFFGQLIQLATTYDNTGSHPHVKDIGKLIHESTRATINESYPRIKWCKFFAGIIRQEETIKPWCHTTHLVNFAQEVEYNKLMKQWE